MNAPKSAPRQPKRDPWEDLPPAVLVQRLLERRWSAVTTARGVGLALGTSWQIEGDLFTFPLLLVVTQGQAGEAAWKALCAAHPDGKVNAPSWRAEGTVVRVLVHPGGDSTRLPSVELVPGVTLVTSGTVDAPGSVTEGHTLLRWQRSAHACDLDPPEAPAWLVRLALDDTARAQSVVAALRDLGEMPREEGGLNPPRLIRFSEPGDPPPADTRVRITVSRRVSHASSAGGTLAERATVPDLARQGLDALSVTPWGERLFTLDGSNPPAMVHVLPPNHAPLDRSSPDSSPRARVVTTSKHVLRGLLSGAARWVAEGAGKNGREEHELDPPEAVVAFALETCESLRPLRAVVESPVMRADGTVIAANGYDHATGLYAAFDPDAARAALASIPEAPTQEEASRALARLSDLVCDFPFEKPAHRACWVAGVITMFAREMFHGPAPLFFVRANTRGSGKTLLTELPHILATGERPAMMGWPGDEQELEKSVTAEAMAGARCIVIDNITGSMKSACLDRILTSGKHRARILGGNTRFDGPMLAVWWASGNNVETSDDLARRTAPVELVAREERPEQRQGFAADASAEAAGETGTAALRAKARNGRWGYVADALTILRAWHCAGRPSSGLSSWGSFESWSRVVRGALVFAGSADPGEAHEEFRDSAAADVGMLRGLLGAMHGARGELNPQGEPVGRMVKRIIAGSKGEAGGIGGDAGDALRESLEAITGESVERWRREHTERAGKFFRTNRRKVCRVAGVGSLSLDQNGETHGSARWRVVLLSAESSVSTDTMTDHPGGMGGDGGVGGDVSTTTRAQTGAHMRTHAHAPALAASGGIPPITPIPPADSWSEPSDFDDYDPERAAIESETEGK